MESTRIGIGERKKYTKAAYKKAGGEQNGRKLFRIKKKRAPKIAGTICIMSSTCGGFMWLR